MEHKYDQKNISEALIIEAEELTKAGKVGYMARVVVQATLPHKETAGITFQRTNGNYKLVITSPEGLPFGSIPRLLLSWVTTEALKTHSPLIVLGASLSEFMAQLSLCRTGGPRGDITRFVKQAKRLFTSSIYYSGMIPYDGQSKFEYDTMPLTDGKKSNLWWDAKSPKQMPLWRSSVTLTDDFFKEIIDRPVPVDMAALMALKRSPLALDIYCWLTYRLSYLQKDALIPWELLQMQFGADYGKDAEGLRSFKKNFLLRLKSVIAIYDKANVYKADHGLLLKPSPPHVPKRLIPEIARSRKRLLPTTIAAVEEAAERLAPIITFESHAPISLKLDTFEKAKKVAPGFDIYFLEAEWIEWIDKKGECPNNPDAAFIGFCKRKAQKA
jgi:hypothetical protein